MVVTAPLASKDPQKRAATPPPEGSGQLNGPGTAVFAAIVELLTVRFPPLQMPPPCAFATFPERVELLIVRLPPFSMPAPYPEAPPVRLPESVELVTVAVPSL